MSMTKYDCQSCGQLIDCTCNASTAVPCVACSSHVCVSGILKDNPDITSREYLRRRIWAYAYVASTIARGTPIGGEGWAGIALDAYDEKFRDSEDKP